MRPHQSAPKMKPKTYDAESQDRTFSGPGAQNVLEIWGAHPVLEIGHGGRDLGDLGRSRLSEEQRPPGREGAGRASDECRSERTENTYDVSAFRCSSQLSREKLLKAKTRASVAGASDLHPLVMPERRRQQTCFEVAAVCVPTLPSAGYHWGIFASRPTS